MNERIVLGLGGTVDYEIDWDDDVVQALAEEYGIRADELTRTAPVTTERDLVVALLAFLADGAGGERFASSSRIVEEFAQRFPRRITLGGTGVRAGYALAVHGLAAVQHLVSIDDHVRRLLPAGTEYVSSATADSTDPHLIVQFPRGARVRLGDRLLVAPHPNRVIFANDPPNRELLLAEELGGVLADAGVFLVSGFNSIQDEAVLADRLETLKRHLAALPADADVIYEDAGFHLPVLQDRARAALLGCVDVVSMNEDELQALLGHRLDLLAPDAVVEALSAAATLLPGPVLVVHTRHWSAAVGAEAERFRAALLGGVTMASTRYLLGDGITAADYDRVAQLPAQTGGVAVCAAVAARLPAVCTPGLVLETDHPTTIGLGDTFAGGFVSALVRHRA
ncbi:ADP-dependent glucokinase/phosphofructokinase [Rathayibacter sp. VKM Ac-2760]|uniref:ADP-dependent glucokinase/phosphofructokinase n=1 Tax=Rathayibacter sp. VKM Ac-2760 TaxID=2609253 RepID=UPI001319664D|nr:ADP-dependent glucokinase/phosphofructokinase [Rathayibacter sp. VKM Ac-2760]QHC59446.1 hypothetical protein GSU72_13450 [Rathayibacter sp. VKM Ac-2760]